MINIIGAGPAGSFAAYSLAKAGYDVDIYEDNLEVGKPVQCTGLTTAALKEVVKLQPNVVMNHIKHATIISPNQASVTIDFKEPNIVLSRCGFDKSIAQMAQDAGASIFLGHRFINATKSSLTLKTKSQTITRLRKSEDYLIGADGPNTTVGKSFGMIEKHSIMPGGQATVILKDQPEDTLEFYPLPQGYYWIVPEGNGVCRVGVAVYEKPHDHLQNFLKKRCPGRQITEYQGGVIPKYNPRLQTYNKENKVMLLGDAASQVKWTTGGGIIQGLIAAKCAANAIETNQNYQNLWKEKLGKDLWLHLQIRNTMDKFSLEDYNKLIALCSQERIKDLLAKHDRDYVMSFLFKLLFKEPRLMLYARHIFT